MIKIINVYKDSRVMEMTTSSNLGLGVKTDNDVDLLRFTFDDFIVGTATLLTTLTDSNGELVAFPLTINQEENSYDLEVTQYVASQTNYTIQIEIVNDDMVWHSKQADITLDECLEIGEGEMPTTIENWLQNANIVLSEMEQATRETENLNIEVGTETSTTIPVTFTDKEGNQTTVNVKGARGEKGEQGIPGSPGTPGQDATINGVNTLTIQEGENISITQSGSTMTISSTGGGGGTSDYTDLTNKPSINSVSLVGNKTSNDLGLPYKKIVVQSSDEVIILDELEVGVYQILDKYNKPKTGFKYKRTSSFSGYYAISGVINGLFQIIKDVSTASNGDSIAYVETYYDPNNSNRKGYYSAEIYISGSSLGLSASGKIGSITTLDDTQIFTAKKTFNVLPESSVAPTTNNQLVNKKYVDDSITSAITDALGGSY